VETTEVSLRSVLRVLVERRRLIILNVLVVVAAAVVISLVLPYRYTATTTILPAGQESGAGVLGALLQTQLPLAGLGGVAPAGISLLTSPSDLIAAFASSRSVCEAVVRECQLMELWELDEITLALRRLEGITRISVTPEGILVISVTERTPELAAKIAGAYVRELDRVNRELDVRQIQRKREFIERRLAETEATLRAAEDSLKAFGENRGTILLEDEAKAAIQAAAQLKVAILVKDAQLGALYEYATASHPQALLLEREIAQLQRELRRIELGFEEGGGRGGEDRGPYLGTGAGFSVPFSELPEAMQELARRTRAVEVQTAVYTLLVQEYETAKIAEARDTPTIRILDPAEPPERRSFPKRKRLVVFAGIFAFLVSCGLAFTLEFIERVSEKEPEESDWRWMLDELRGDLSRIMPWRRRRAHRIDRGQYR
jgi:tyrosine-protein kinase Etk/Wzc